MGIYGQTAKQILENQPIVITLEDTIENDILTEATVKLSKKGNEVELYVRDNHLATKGSSIPNDKSVSTINHAASVKIRNSENERVPIEIHDNEVDFDEKTYPGIKKVPKR